MTTTATLKTLLLSLLLMLCSAGARSENGPDSPGDTRTDAMSMARQWCDTAALDNIEGIWLLPADNVYLSVRRDSHADMARYTLTVVAATDGQLSAGQRIGTLQPMPDRRTYVVSLPRSRDSHNRLRLRDVRMELTQQGNALVAAPGDKTVRFSFSPLSLLPGFWKMVRLTISPATRPTVHGMVRIYPGYDLNGSDRLTPRYF